MHPHQGFIDILGHAQLASAAPCFSSGCVEQQSGEETIGLSVAKNPFLAIFHPQCSRLVTASPVLAGDLATAARELPFLRFVDVPLDLKI